MFWYMQLCIHASLHTYVDASIFIHILPSSSMHTYIHTCACVHVLGYGSSNQSSLLETTFLRLLLLGLGQEQLWAGILKQLCMNFDLLINIMHICACITALVSRGYTPKRDFKNVLHKWWITLHDNSTLSNRGLLHLLATSELLQLRIWPKSINHVINKT